MESHVDWNWVLLNLKQGGIIFGCAFGALALLFLLLVISSRGRNGRVPPVRPVQEPPYDPSERPTLPRLEIARTSDPAAPTSDLTQTISMSREQLMSSFLHGEDLQRFLAQEKDIAVRLIQQTHVLAAHCRDRMKEPDVTEAEMIAGFRAELILLEAEDASLDVDDLEWGRLGHLYSRAKQAFYDALLPSQTGQVRLCTPPVAAIDALDALDHRRSA